MMSLREAVRAPGREKPRDAVDVDLLRSISAGDEQALERLYQLYFRKLIGFAMRITGRTESAEEVASDTLMAVWRGAKSFEGRSRPSTWIFGIAYRIALKSRHRARHEREEADLPEGVEIPDEDSGKTLENLFLRHQLMRAMSQLSPEHRAVVQLTYYYGYSYPEIAEIMACPVGTVKSRMSHARSNLNQILVDTHNTTEEEQNV